LVVQGSTTLIFEHKMMCVQPWKQSFILILATASNQVEKTQTLPKATVCSNHGHIIVIRKILFTH